MKRIKSISLAVAAICAVSSISAQHVVNEHFTTYDLPTSKLHVFQSGDPMGDVSFIVEGKKGLVILEQPTFYSAIEQFGDYVKALDKPVVKAVANYHSGGLAQYSTKVATMPEKMIAFGNSPMAQGMIAKFTKAFGEAADFRPVARVKGFKVPSAQKWAGVSLDFTNGVATDFPAASIQIDHDAFYTHFAPAKSHLKPMQAKSMEAIDALLAEMLKIKASGAKYVFGSHGANASIEEVDFTIEYINKVKELRAEYNTADLFGQRLLMAYPEIAGVESIKAIAKSLYPNEVANPEVEAVRTRMQDYLDTVSNLDMKLARDLWADNENISLIAPRGHYVGFEGITKKFLYNAFSSFKSRKLSSLSETINIYGDSANLQLYWKFDTVDKDGVSKSGRGRESLIFAKINGEWKLVHVHYSPMPKAN